MPHSTPLDRGWTRIVARACVALAAALAVIPAGCETAHQGPAQAAGALPSWSDGPARHAIVAFVDETTTPGSPSFVPEPDRIATFDQDGTLWVEHPIYTQFLFCVDRVKALVREQPQLMNEAAVRTVVEGGPAAATSLPKEGLIRILELASSGMTVDQYAADVRAWLESARDPRWRRPFTELVYAPMLEVMRYLHDHGFTVYIVTGGGQDFVRVYADRVYGLPPERIVGTAGETTFESTSSGASRLVKAPELLLFDDKAGKPSGIHFMIGRRPIIAFGNSTGDLQMLEYATGAPGRRMGLLVLHDDPVREYAYGPALGLPKSHVGTFTQELYDTAQARGWAVISMKNDWSRIFNFAE